jgi:hypothetical protein
MVADRRPTGQHLPMAEAHRLIGLHRRTVVAHPRIAPRRRMAVAAVVEEAEHLPITVVEAGPLHRAAEVATAVEAEGDVPLLAAATVAIAN